MAEGAAERVTIRLLGPIDVESTGGHVTASPSALRRTLLALLAIRVREVVPADWLLEHAWHGEPPESGLRALRFHISQLRRELPDPSLIETRPGGYRLAIEADDVDAAVMEQSLRRARSAASPTDAVAVLQEAVSLWRGDPFIDASPCPLLDDEARRLVDLRDAIVDSLYTARVEAGSDLDVVADLLRLVAEHPLREALWAALITAQYRAGRQADALRSYEQLRVALSEAGLAPSPELRELQARILDQDQRLTVRHEDAVRGNTPSPPTSLIDSRGLVGLVSAMVREHRTVTLSGPGGVGKSRLAIAVATDCAADFAGGAWFVELAAVTRSDGVIAAVASALSLRPQAGMSLVDTMVDWFHARPSLLVLDNCEHILPDVRDLVRSVVSSCPSVKLLMTSREPVGVAGERVHRVEPLEPTDDGLALFVDRALAVDSTFALSSADRSVVIEICRKLDALPLAIELAAARISSMTPTELLARLDDRFRLLRARTSDSNLRHDALRNTVEWSYRLLPEAERSVFVQLSVFSGDFDVDAARAVCTPSASDESDAVDLLDELVHRSLVVAIRSPNGTRFRLLETIRAFAAEQLESEGLLAEARDRHLRHFADVAGTADTLFRTREQEAGAARLNAEWGNIGRAVDWAATVGDIESAERLVRSTRFYADERMQWEHREWCRRYLALCESMALAPNGEVLGQALMWAMWSEDITETDALRAHALELVDAEDPAWALLLVSLDVGDDPRFPDPLAPVLAMLDQIDLDRDWWLAEQLADKAPLSEGKLDAALRRMTEIAARVRAPRLLIETDLVAAGRALLKDLDFSAAFDLSGRALEIARTTGDSVAIGDSQRMLSLAAVGLLRADAAQICGDALVQLYEVRRWMRIWQLFGSVGLEWAVHGKLEPAALTLGKIEVALPEWGYEYELGFRARTRELVATDDRWTSWTARGAEMDRHDIVALALRELSA